MIGVRCGAWQVDWVTDGTWWLDGGSMYGRVPRAMWERLTPPDELNRVALTCRALLLRNDDGTTALVDTGLGRTYDDRMAEQIGLSDRWELLEGLESLGVTPDKIHYVLLTHLHFDHVGGAVRKDGDRIVPTFPNARHLVVRAEWEAAHQEHILLRRSYVPHTFDTLHDAGLIDWVAADTEVLPGVKIETTGGHTVDHQMVLIEGDGETVCYPVDLMPMAGHINPAWVPAFDVYPLDTVRKRVEMLGRAEKGDWLVVLDHDPERATGRIGRDEKGRFAWRDA